MLPSHSVIICTHNPRQDYLRRTLDGLRAQTFPRDRWELLLIDNASSEQLAGKWDLSWHPISRHVREEELGLTAARMRGIREARGEMLVFVDDDNLLASDFLEKLESIAARYPYLGVIGPGNVQPEFEIQPPSGISRLADENEGVVPFLALRSATSPAWSNNAKDRSLLPWGAGLCATRELSEQYLTLISRLNINATLGRRGNQLLCAEDDLFSWASVQIGKGFGVFPELRVTHLIPARRVAPGYFVRLIQGWGLSHGVLNYLLLGAKPRRGGLERRARILLGGLRHGWFHMRCKMAEMRGEDQALRFISERQLRPLDAIPHIMSDGSR